MNMIVYEKEADIQNHFYYMFFKDMKLVHYKFAGSHIHKSIEMVICVSGKMRTIVNDNEKILSKGDILIINSYDWHFYEYIDNASCYILVLAEDYINDLLSSNNKEFNNHISLSNEDFERLEPLLSANFVNFDKLTFVGKKAFALTMFAILENYDLFRAKKNNVNKTTCRMIIDYVKDHYHQKITIDSVAKHFGYSRNYFSSLFNKLFGETFNSFVNRYRVNEVLKLHEENPDLLMEDIIYKAGFTSRVTYYRSVQYCTNQQQTDLRNK